MQNRQLRIALYSHDTLGLGHTRRNLLVAQALGRLEPRPAILLLFGVREAAGCPFPPGAEALTLPAFRKDAQGGYRARTLDLPVERLAALRASMLRAALEEFDPDLLIVDKVPRGALGELEPALRMLRRRGRARLVLGLRDILDRPEAVAAEWRREGTLDTLRRYYDAIWVYGDSRIADPVREYGLPFDLAARVRFTGYLDPRGRLGGPETLTHGHLLPEGPFALCVVGGGEDGAALVEAFADAAPPAGWARVIVTGPFLPDAAVYRLARRAEQDLGLQVLRFVEEPGRLLERAARVVAMGGYNTVAEILAYGKHALVVPRVRPRAEQLIRASRLARLGFLDLLHPDHLSAAAVSRWLATPLPVQPEVRARLDFNGLERLPGLAREVLDAAPRRLTATSAPERSDRRVAV